MQTPNWGPQAGVPMDQATFDAYVAQYPPGQLVGSNPKDQFSTGATDIYGQQATDTQTANAGAKYWEDFYNRGPGSVQMPGFQTQNQDQARLQQQQVIQALQAQAAGDPNSMAQQQLQQGYASAGAQQSSLGSTMRGQSAGAARRGIQQGQQGIQRGYAGDQQMLMAQEQQAAQGMLAQLLAQQQGQDINQAQGTAQGQLQGSALDQQMQQFYAQSGLNAGLNRAQTSTDLLNAQFGFDLEKEKMYNDLIRSGQNATAGVFGGLAQTDWRSESQRNIDNAFDGK